MKGPQKSLKSWTDADWDYAGEPKKSRYLPKSARDSLTSAQKAAGNRRKRKANRQGKQRAKYTEAEKRAFLRASKKNKTKKKK